MKKDNLTPSTEMIIGIVLIVVGIVCIFLAGVVEAFVRLVIGGWILFSGINRLINTLYMNNKDSKFWVSLVLSILLIGGGLYTILEVNLAFKAIGIVLMIYAVIEIVGYIFNRKEVTVVKTEIQTKEKIKDAEVIETKEIKKKKGSKK